MTKKEKMASDMLQDIAKSIDEKLPDGMGFALLTYEFGDEEKDRKLLYVSNSNRLDVMNAMIEFLQKHMDNPEMYGKDI